MPPKYKYGPVEKSGRRKRYQRVPGNMATYIAGMPCQNPNCSSHGKPHPNCRCYGSFADGGEVEHFCSNGMPHNPECEYFSSGGEALPSFDEMKSMEGKKESLPSFDEMKKSSIKDGPTPIGKLPSFDEMKSMSEPATDPGVVEQLKAGLEGASQGVLGGLAKVAQVKSGISTIEDIERREKEFPATHAIAKSAGFAGSLYAGPAKAIASSVGSKLLGNILAMTAYSGADNVSKAFLGQADGDVKSVVAGTILNGGMDGLMNTLTEGMFSRAPTVAKALLGEKTIRAAENFMINFAEKPVSKAATAFAAKHVGTSGILSDIAEYNVLKETVKPWVEKIIGKPLTKANEYVGDAVLNTLAKTNFLGVPAAIRFSERAASGLSQSKAVESLFKSGLHEIVGKTRTGVEDEIRQWMEDGGIDGEMQRASQDESHGLAIGGTVKKKGEQHFANIYPVENILINEARGRVSGYLNSLRPSKNQSRLPFDSPVPQTQKEKSYKKAIGYAANPMSILNHVNKGTLTPEDMSHFKSMWPEAHELLSKKMNEGILRAQLKGDKPAYAKRQAMSLFLGANLDSTFTPQSIATIQGIYASKKPQQDVGAQQGSKKALAKSSNPYLTPEQSRERRLQNQK